MVDYYRILGVKSTASVREIKSAYKRLARIRHPDLNGGSPEAARAFLEISRARDILIDPQRRAAYDAQRHAHASGSTFTSVANPTIDTYLRRTRSDVRIRKNLENFLTIERAETRRLRQAIFPIVAFLFASFFVPLIRPHFWRSSGLTGRVVILVLAVIGAWHTVQKIWAAIKLYTDDAPGRLYGRRQVFLLIGLATLGCALLGTLIGVSFSESLLSAMPMFFDPAIRLELLLYPWIMVLLIDSLHSLSQRMDI